MEPRDIRKEVAGGLIFVADFDFFEITRSRDSEIARSRGHEVTRSRGHEVTRSRKIFNPLN